MKSTFSCSRCADFQEKQIGNAPPRPKIVETSMYDHMDHFYEYRRKKEKEEKVRSAKERIPFLNPAFTNFKVKGKDFNEVLQMLNLKHSKKLKKLIENNKNFDNQSSIEQLPINEESHQSEKDNESIITRNKSLVSISRSPIICPVKSCQEMISVTSILAHFARDHKQKSVVEIDEIDTNQRSIILIDPNFFQFNENVCLGVIAYGGDSLQERPAALKICTQNKFLPERYSHLIDHLPIAILGCKTSLCSIVSSNGKESSEVKTHECGKSDEILIIWLCTLETTKRVFCTLTVFNKGMSCSRSTIHEVRNFNTPQDPLNFFTSSTNYLWLTQGDLQNLTNNNKDRFKLEIYINMYD